MAQTEPGQRLQHDPGDEHLLTEQVLDGIGVLDLSDGISGSYCGKMLAGFGAEVIKLEKPGAGDSTRRLGPFPDDIPHPEKSGAFLYHNSGKKSVTLNIETAAGRDLLRQLVAETDVLVENFQPSVLPKLGLGYTALSAINPRLVMTSITGFGQTGPYRDFKMESIAGYALGGHQYINGEPDREPLQGAGPQPEYLGGIHGFFGTVTGLFSREDTGRGHHVDVSIMECLAGFHQFTIIRYTYGGEIKSRTGNRYEAGPTITIYPCKDGHIALSASSPMQQELLFALVGMPDLAEDFAGVTAHRDDTALAEAFDERLKPWFQERTKEEIFHTCSEWRIPCAPVTHPGELLDDPHFRERGFWRSIDHPVAGRLPYPGAPFRLTETPWQPGRAPLLGEHNREIYGRLGYDGEDLVRLRQGGVI